MRQKHLESCSICDTGWMRVRLIINPYIAVALSLDQPGLFSFHHANFIDFAIDISSAENRHPNLNRLIGRFNERSSILDRSLSHSKHVTMNLG